MEEFTSEIFANLLGESRDLVTPDELGNTRMDPFRIFPRPDLGTSS